ncbi:phosphatase PAP2 family protein [Candidatus Saccharibacteria bacterium]|nr:phosphatase PAP2 family protein [Candidatus Saccharibacteria bacterium]
MIKIKQHGLPAIGFLGTLTCLVLFALTPSFPTPDKLIIFLTFVFMIFSNALQMLKRLLPFVVVLLSYESFRSVADHLNSHVDYSFAPYMDRILFGGLPTAYLQNLLWHGHVSWYDFVFYLAYMLHFIIPIGLAILVWKTRVKHYWRLVSTYVVAAFAAFLTYLAFPAAPPWLASQNHYIEPITRISSHVWASLGLSDFPSFYNNISPNPVAAVPSLHAAWATLFAIFVYKIYGRRWAALAAIYPLLIYVGTVYQGEHYGFDVITGIIYGFASYKVTPYVILGIKKLFRAKYSSSTKNA